MRFSTRVAALLIAATATSLALPAEAATAASHSRTVAVAATVPTAPSVTLSAPLAAPQLTRPKPSMRITYGWGMYLNGWGWEWRAVAAAIMASSVGAVVAGCAIANLPGPLAKALRLVCSTIGATSLKIILSGAVRAYRQRRFRTSSCYQVNLLRLGSAIHRVRARGNCYVVR